jgi:hypothetical protein
MTSAKYNRNDDSMMCGSFHDELTRADGKWINHPILQRDPSTWSTEQEYFFIDSLFNDFVVNPITVSERDAVFRILEGGHRVHTIKKFMGNEMKYNGLYFKEMSTTIRDIFKYRKIRYTIYQGLSNLEEEQFILRVNMGLPINSGEFVNMMPSIELLWQCICCYPISSRMTWSKPNGSVPFLSSEKMLRSIGVCHSIARNYRIKLIN